MRMISRETPSLRPLPRFGDRVPAALEARLCEEMELRLLEEPERPVCERVEEEPVLPDRDAGFLFWPVDAISVMPPNCEIPYHCQDPCCKAIIGKIFELPFADELECLPDREHSREECG